MGLRIQALELIEAIKPFLQPNPICYMIGTQDCKFTYKMLIKKYPKEAQKIRSDNKDLHKQCDLKTVFAALGFNSITTIDINNRADIRIDLTVPFPKEHYEKADLVCEIGTLEHIFDIKTAIENINLFLKKGGIVFHMSPVSCYQHGFLNFNPNFFDALYSASGYKQIFRTMNVSIFHPLYVVNRKGFPAWLRYFITLTNKICQPPLLYRFNLPLSYNGNNKILSFFNFWISHFKPSKNLMYCCAYQKTSDCLKIPYDIYA